MVQRVSRPHKIIICAVTHNAQSVATTRARLCLGDRDSQAGCCCCWRHNSVRSGGDNFQILCESRVLCVGLSILLRCCDGRRSRADLSLLTINARSPAGCRLR